MQLYNLTTDAIFMNADTNSILSSILIWYLQLYNLITFMHISWMVILTVYFPAFDITTFRRYQGKAGFAEDVAERNETDDA